MADRIVISSNQIDSQGDVMAIQALEMGMQQINGERKLVYTINHRRELPPLGRNVDALLERSNNIMLLTASAELYQRRETIQWGATTLIAESFEKGTPFIGRRDDRLEGLGISLDHANFISCEAFERFNRVLYDLDNNVQLEMHGRKADIPFPEIIIQIGKAAVLYKLIAPFAKKITEKLAEDVYEFSKEQLKNFVSYVTKVCKSTREQAIPKDKRLTIILEIHSDPFIELLVKSDDASMLPKALSEKKLTAIQTDLRLLCESFDVDRVQFIWADKGNWKFNYLITVDGKAIGNTAAFKERDRQYERYKMLQSTLNSVGMGKGRKRK